MPLKVHKMRVLTPSKRAALRQDIEKIYQEVRAHHNNLTLFEQWYEVQLEEIGTTCEELWLLEELTLRSHTGDVQHTFAPLLMAAAYSKASNKIYDMIAYSSDTDKIESGSGRVNRILSPIGDALRTAAEDCLVVNDNSKLALGQDEYAEMTTIERDNALNLQARHIMQFFCTAHDELLNDPDKPLMNEIALKLATIAAKKTPRKVKIRRVSFKIPRLSAKNKDATPNPAPGEFIRKVAKRQALLIQQIRENEETLRCFFLKDNESLQLCTADHPTPSKLVKILYRQVCDVMWEKFQEDFNQTAFHLRITEKLRNHPNHIHLSTKAILELQTRYDVIKDLEREYLEVLLRMCNHIYSNTVKKFSSPCDCGHILHINVITGPIVSVVE